jgi:hypothetical protein
MIKKEIGRLQTLLIAPLMLVLVTMATAMLTGGLISCSGKTDEDIYKDNKKEDRASRGRTSTSKQTGAEKSRESSATQMVPRKTLIKKVYHSPQAGRADAEMKIIVETTEPIKENQYISFIHWKNGKKSPETGKDTFPPFSFKKGEATFSDVLLYQDGELIEMKRTDIIQIANSKPVIKEVIFPEVRGPGTYTLEVIAEDGDKDQLTFSLEKEELPVDVQVDPSTGVITCILDKDTPEVLRFIIVVNDGDGGVAKKVITQKFFKEAVKKDQT